MKLLLIGAQSSVGAELIKLLDERGISWVAPKPKQVNPAEPLGVARTITQASPDQVINLSAYGAGSQHAVSDAQSDEEACDLLNHQLAELTAQVCDHLHIPLIHLSTVHVFNGEKKLPYNEQDKPKPAGVYGATALAGEKAIKSTVKQHIIIRDGWLFAPHQDQVLKDWLDQIRKNDGSVSVCRGKVAPTPVEDLARVLVAVALQVDCHADVWGIYHYAALEPLRQSELLQQLVKSAAQYDETIYRLLDHLTINLVRREAPQIANATLNTKKIFETFGIKPRPWQGSLQQLVKSWYK